jgi:hypothetical protein
MMKAQILCGPLARCSVIVVFRSMAERNVREAKDW